ncbi:hypothetical protein KI387_017283, partial [Taxus chinensis]
MEAEIAKELLRLMKNSEKEKEKRKKKKKEDRMREEERKRKLWEEQEIREIRRSLEQLDDLERKVKEMQRKVMSTELKIVLRKV